LRTGRRIEKTFKEKGGVRSDGINDARCGLVLRSNDQEQKKAAAAWSDGDNLPPGSWPQMPGGWCAKRFVIPHNRSRPSTPKIFEL
jgi:hypothetical protein